jgi:D-sedoheptulose 7-phosphate isomerase
VAKDYKARRGFDELIADRRGLLDSPHYRDQTVAIADAIVAALRAGNKVLWCGNGGSAAEAQHMAAELSGRFLRERP